MLTEPEKHENHHDEKQERESHGEVKRIIIVIVNEQEVKLHGPTATGSVIKAEAIKQGVHIQQNFILHEELPNGTYRIIGDNDEVRLREHLCFTAIAPDDNS